MAKNDALRILSSPLRCSASFRLALTAPDVIAPHRALYLCGLAPSPAVGVPATAAARRDSPPYRRRPRCTPDGGGVGPPRRLSSATSRAAVSRACASAD